MFLTILIVSLMVGAVAGLINGLLGGGVGLVLVPALVWIFSLEHVPHEILMQMAVGTGVTSIVISAIIATFSHHNHGTIDWSICKKMFLPIVFGVLMGSLIANHLPTRWLFGGFGLLVLLLAYYIFYVSDDTPPRTQAIPKGLFEFAGWVFGLLSSILGINPFSVPFLKRMGLDIRVAISTSVVLGLTMAASICVMYLLMGLHRADLPPYSTGYVNWPALLPIAIASAIAAPLGSKLAHRLSRQTVRRCYCLLMLVVGIKMLWAAFF